MKKFISVMLVAAMAVTALTGCGSNSGSSSKKDADKYYIGGIGPTTGATAIYGTAVKNGAQIAVDEIMLQVVLTVSRLNTVLKMTRTMQRKQLMLTIH